MAAIVGGVAVIFSYVAAAVVAGWGVAHAVPTGARTTVVWFKLCPVVLAGSAALLMAASVV